MKPFLTCLVLTLAATVAQTSELVIRNNHHTLLQGPVRFETSAPEGYYQSSTGRVFSVRGGQAEGVVALDAKGEKSYRLAQGNLEAPSGPLTVQAITNGLQILWGGKKVATVDFQLAVSNSKVAPENIAAGYMPTELAFEKHSEGWHAEMMLQPYVLVVSARVYPEGYIDFTAEVTVRTKEATPASVILARRVRCAEVRQPQLRWNGRMLDTDIEPEVDDSDKHYSQGVDWMSWSSEGLHCAQVNGWASALAALRGDKWFCSKNHFLYEKMLRAENDLFFFTMVSDVGDNRGVMQPNQTVAVHWRMAFTDHPGEQWGNSLLLALAGCNRPSEERDKTVFDFGAPFVKFGVSYHPYSTLTENFDFYRVKGLDREGWWAFSPEMWKEWRQFRPDMQRDLRIIKAMGFEAVRPHYCGHLRYMRRAEALEFLDWFMGECRRLGLRILMDSEGEPEWMVLLATRYRDLIDRYELCNEIMLQASYSGLPAERIGELKEAYSAIRAACPGMPIHVTSNGSTGMFEQARRLGLPFDGYGVHYYRHGPGWMDILESQSLGSGTYATRLGLPALLTEFNWKNFTAMAPPERLKYVSETYDRVMKVRAFPEVYLFHFHETLSPNPRLGRNATRHYEAIALDRRPKETFEPWMKQMDAYARPELPFRQLRARPVGVPLENNKGRARFEVHNSTERRLEVVFTPEGFNELALQIAKHPVSFAPGQSRVVELQLALPESAPPGVYHFFLRAEFDGCVSYLWGWAEKQGRPRFDATSVLPDYVSYPQGPDIVDRLDFSWPITVVFAEDKKREKTDSRNVEMAYIVYHTLRAASGKSLYLCPEQDTPSERGDNDSLILIGRREDFERADFQPIPDAHSGDRGTLYLKTFDDGRQWLYLTGDLPKGVEAAAMDFVLRYWKNAKDSAIRRVGMEQGHMLGKPAETGLLNPP